VTDWRAVRRLVPEVLGALVRRYGRFDACEDAVQEALLAAAAQWPVQGWPSNPRGWLVTVASRRLADQLRSDTARRRREQVDAARIPPPPAGGDASLHLGARGPAGEDTLTLLFLCCHPALSPASQVALTLRAVGGLSTAEIARAFLVPEATMAQRISRAKQRIKATGATFDLPPPVEQAQRLGLMLLTDARRPARTAPDGSLVPLSEQDRSLWDAEAIAEGVALVTRALSNGPLGPYQLQAAIAAVHDEAPSAEATDWAQILALYTLLERTAPNPMVSLNRAVALAMVRGPAAGLAVLDSLSTDERIAGFHHLVSVRAHLLEMAGDRDAARSGYREAARRTTSEPERRHLLTRAARLG
jgi:RNA polymerase sigma factor (sigma-70 family)